jgi:Mg-chelatase subunit ChlD
MSFDRPLLLVALGALPLVLLLVLLSRSELAGVRRVTSALLRAATLAALALAAAAPAIERAGGRAATCFVLDVSPSVRVSGARPVIGIEKLRELARSLPGDDPVALVCFAGEAKVVLEPGPASRFEKLSPDDVRLRAEGDATDIARALRLAEATIGSGRIILLSDGRETHGDARDEAARLRGRGLRVDTVAIPETTPLDACIVRVEPGSPEAREGEGLLVRVEVEASRPCSGEVTLSRDGETRPAWTRPVELSPRPTALVFHDRAERVGVHHYEARVQVAGDVEPANDTRGAAVIVKGGPRALVIELSPTDGEAVTRVLTAQGMTVKRATPAEVDLDTELAGADLTILASGELDAARARALESWVREGGGLLALGGARSYGSWRKTDVEEALPVVAEPDQVERPSVALVIAIDKSGSMRGPKLELAKLAARNAVWGLGKEDMLGIIAFNYNAYWIVPLERIRDRAQVQAQIEMQAAGGGTDLMPSLREAKAVLLPSDARVKHFLVLTDGIAGDGDAVCAYAGDLARSGITTSTVAVGEDADQDLLQRISIAGNGHHHNASRVSELPRIVLEEALVCARQAMEEEPFKIVRRARHEALAGVDLETAPALHGLSATKAKPLASVLLEGPRGLPLLAVWEHGLGRAAAWTSDLSPRWADEFLRHESFPKLLSQLARHVARREGRCGLEVELTAKDSPEGVHLRAEARRADGRFASDLRLDAQVRSVHDETDLLPLELTAPGRYEGLAAVGSGSWLATARLGQVPLATCGFARGASPELERLGADRAALEAIARSGGGSLDALAGNETPLARTSRDSLEPFLLELAALLLVVEVVVRRAPKP